MNKQCADFLARFCVSQHDEFSPDAWLNRSDVAPEAIGLAAKYLSQTSWYGHEHALEEIARRNNFAAQSTGLYRESRAIDFDLSYFSFRVRTALLNASKAGNSGGGGVSPPSISHKAE